MKPFPFDEPKYYRFGLMLGVSSLLHNGLRLGMSKTVGKILQPINSYTRFPEYWFMASQLERYLPEVPEDRPIKVLDVGSPKCFGLYIAFQFGIDVYLTDIDEPSIKEAEVLWNSIRDRARGRAYFSVEDARSLKYATDEFDIVYSMSVVEHVEGEDGDSESMKEMLRVLKPSGLLMVTVPAGDHYIEQERLGLQRAARTTGTQERFFFQRIYSPTAATERLAECAGDMSLSASMTVWRKEAAVTRWYQRLGSGARGICGWLNPFLSAAINKSANGMMSIPGKYGSLYSGMDIYGDLMLAWRKPAARLTRCA